MHLNIISEKTISKNSIPKNNIPNNKNLFRPLKFESAAVLQD